MFRFVNCLICIHGKTRNAVANKSKFLLPFLVPNVEMLIIMYSLISVVSGYSKVCVPNQFVLTESL